MDIGLDGGNTDPYVVLSIKDGATLETRRTTTKNNIVANCSWDGDDGRGEELTFPSTLGRQIEVECWDDDGIASSDDLIGKGRVEIPEPAVDAPSAEEDAVRVWVQLQRDGREGRENRGRVQLEVKAWQVGGKASIFKAARTTVRTTKLHQKSAEDPAMVESSSNSDTAKRRALTKVEAACKIQAAYRGRLARKKLKITRHSSMRKAEGRDQSSLQARTARQKALERKMELNRKLHDKVVQFLKEELEQAAAASAEEQGAEHEEGLLPQQPGPEPEPGPGPGPEPEPLSRLPGTAHPSRSSRSPSRR